MEFLVFSLILAISIIKFNICFDPVHIIAPIFLSDHISNQVCDQLCTLNMGLKVNIILCMEDLVEELVQLFWIIKIETININIDYCIQISF